MVKWMWICCQRLKILLTIQFKIKDLTLSVSFNLVLRNNEMCRQKVPKTFSFDLAVVDQALLSFRLNIWSLFPLCPSSLFLNTKSFFSPISSKFQSSPSCSSEVIKIPFQKISIYIFLVNILAWLSEQVFASSIVENGVTTLILRMKILVDLPKNFLHWHILNCYNISFLPLELSVFRERSNSSKAFIPQALSRIW